MDETELKVSVMVLGEMLRTPKYDEMQLSDIVSESVVLAKLMITELIETQK